MRIKAATNKTLTLLSYSSVLKNISTLWFIGYLPIAPGTFSSFAAMVFFYLLKPPFSVHVFLLLALIIVGTIASHRTERFLNEKDSSHIVIDEFAGYALSLLFVPVTIPYSLAAFLLFRFFDILKPLPIKWMEKILPGGVGIMADDLMAGVFTNVLLQVWIHLAQS